MKSSSSGITDRLCMCARNVWQTGSLNKVTNICSCHFAAIRRNELDLISTPESDLDLLDSENTAPTNDYHLVDDEEIMTWIPLLPAGILRQSSHSLNTDKMRHITAVSDDPPILHYPIAIDRRPSSNPFLSGSLKAASLSQQNRSRRRSHSSAPYDRFACPFISKIKEKIRTHSLKRVDQACSMMSIIELEEEPSSVPDTDSLPCRVPGTNELRWINSVKSLVL
jgi:hypothetical protein